MKHRNKYFDFLRGIAIIFVVAIHTYNCEENSLVLRQFLNCAVPIFVAISGFFLYNNSFHNKDEYFRFLRKQALKVYLPTLVWSFPLLVIDAILGIYNFSSLLLYFLCGYSIYYFIAFIIQCYVFLPIFKKIFKISVWGGVIGSVVISMGWMIFIVKYNMIEHMNIPLLLYAGVLPCWLMFFILGMKISERKDRSYNLLFPSIIALFGFVMSVIESYYLFNNYSAGWGIKPSAFIYSLGVILVLFSISSELFYYKYSKRFRYVTYLGEMSFSVYLTHCYLLRIVGRMHINNWFFRTILTLVLTLIFIKLIQIFLPQKYHKYVGV